MGRSAPGVTSLGTFSADAAGQLDVLGHDGDSLGVDSAQVGVLEEPDQVGFARLLQCHHSGALETQVGLEVLSDLADQTLEGQLAYEQLGALLVTTDLTQGDRSWPVTVGLLNSSGGRGALPGGFGGELFPGSLTSSGFTGSLLSSSHGDASLNQSGTQ